MDDILFDDGSGKLKTLTQLRAEYDRITQANPSPLCFSEWLEARRSERKKTIQAMPAIRSPVQETVKTEDWDGSLV